jgi:saccharopine dehydrogenase (NADP+, L-glutamate forming)
VVANNPLKFKFSWSPRGALLSQYNSAEFIKDGQIVRIARDDLMAHAKPRYVMDGYSFVGYPNRNSVPFREFYGIPEAQTVVRGSLRYEGNPELFRALVLLGWIDTEPKEWLKDCMTWAQIQSRLIGIDSFDEK